jgi:carbon storage regulator
MLITHRREGESIRIGDDIEVHILDIRKSKIKLGIVAPRSVTITTREVMLVREQNLAAAQVRSAQVLESLIETVLKQA